MSPSNSRFADAASSLRQAVIFQQLDDLNALRDALLGASHDADPERLLTIAASIGRHTLAATWNEDAAWSAIVTYVQAHLDFPEDLFAPALLLQAIAPDHEQTTALFARLPPPVRDLLALATRLRPPRA